MSKVLTEEMYKKDLSLVLEQQRHLFEKQLNQLKSQLDKAQSDLLECNALLEREKKCTELALGVLESIAFLEDDEAIQSRYWLNKCDRNELCNTIANDTLFSREVLTKIKSLREQK